MARRKFDAIVVGSGAGGGVAACVLAEGGKSVLLLEKGEPIVFANEPRDHLRNHRLSAYGHNTGPSIEGNPRVFVDPEGIEHVVKPYEGGYNAVASGVGSGTAVYGGMAWRFHPLDFRMASTYGVPAGSSLADWPIGYEELAPYYEQAEWELGVAGGRPARQMPDRREYPMPPMPDTKKGGILREAASRLGWDTQYVPILANSVRRHGRAACIHCQYCVGFPCPVDAKNGTQNTVIPRALETGRCVLETSTTVTSLLSQAGRVSGVRMVGPSGSIEEVDAEVVVLACSAIETARLLLLSATDADPQGLGNAHDQVGRHLQGHVYTGATALMDESMYDGIGPGPTVATLEFNHGNEGIVGGGMLCDEFVALPLSILKGDRPGWVPSWGLAHKQWFRKAYTHLLQVRGPIHEIPQACSRVTLSGSVRDRLGLPVARLSGTTHRESLRVAEFLRRRAEEWLRATGATDIWSQPASLWLSGGQHQSGTCRMGEDPLSSVVDPSCRVHGMENLFVADGSVHVTNGGFNPVLTIMALSFRTAEGILKRW